MSLWRIACHGGSAAQAPRRESHCLASGWCGGENWFDAANNRDCGCLACSCSLGGNDHYRFIFLEIRECSRGHTIHNLLKISLSPAGTVAAWTTLGMLRPATRDCGLSRSASSTVAGVVASCARTLQTEGNALGDFWRQTAQLRLARDLHRKRLLADEIHYGHHICIGVDGGNGSSNIAKTP